MMNEKQKLVKKIKDIELQIKRLDYHTTNSDVCSDLYNSLILQKAVLKKDLENLNKNPLVEKIKKMLPRREKLICDYFN